MRQRMMIALAGFALAAFSAKADNNPITPVGGKSPVVVNGSGSCSTCANADNVHNQNRHFPGTTMPVGCSCYAAERTFFWGGCKQFFTPQNSCNGSGCGACGGRNRERCPAPPIGPGLGAPANNCAGTFSYLMR